MDEQRFDDLVEDLKRLQKSFNCRYAGIKQAEGSSPRYKAAKRAALDLNKLCKKHGLPEDKQSPTKNLEDRVSLLEKQVLQLKNPLPSQFGPHNAFDQGARRREFTNPLDWVMANK